MGLGLPNEPSSFVARTLVEADLEGISSHGVMLVPMYAARIRAGSVSLNTGGEVVSDHGAVAVIDAGNALGQLTARQAVDLAVAKAKAFGLGAVAVREGFHFGTAGRFAADISAHGCIGIVASNTRPLLPAPGGSEPLVGNNPIAIAMPSPGDGPPVVLDMATSASAMGKIRLAEAAGDPIPSDWATDANGNPTTDPAEAIAGMLLPVGGPKGFGLSLMIDLLCGGLSGGATGAEVNPLYGDPARPYRCAHFFLAIDTGHFGDEARFAATVANAAARVRSSSTREGVEQAMTPGEPAWRERQRNGTLCPIDDTAWAALCDLAEDLGVVPPQTKTEG